MSPALPEWLRALYPFTPKRFKTAAGELSYVDEGPRAREAVLMVHGNPTWSFFYRDLIKDLSPRMRCIAPDHIGCGLSDKPQDWDYTLPNHIANLATLVDSLDLDRVHLVVHDWGGPIGLGAMLPRGGKLGRVVILNTAAFADTRIPWRIRLCRAPLIGELIVRGFNGFAWPATWMAVQRPLADEVKRGFLFPYGNWADRIATHRFVRDIPTGNGSPSDKALAEVEAALPELRRHKVKLLWGGADFCFNLHYLSRWKSILPEATASCHAQAGHYLLEELGAAGRDEIGRHFQPTP
jgi:cis-3-alkyl-4-acyloxetan-2-one decarboxylase